MSQDPTVSSVRLLFISPAAKDQQSFAGRIGSLSGRIDVVTRDFSSPLVHGDLSLAAIVVDCRENQDGIMRILGELDLLGESGRPLIVPLIQATSTDKEWAIAIGADDILVDSFDDTDLRRLLKAVGVFADVRRENARLRQSLDEISRDAQGLRTLAYTDHLTGLPNRLYLENWIKEIIAKSETGFRFAVHMLDLDGFKLVNDQYGHRAGDDILKQVAQRVTALCRRLDLVVRLGGDEIVIVQVGVHSSYDCRAFTSRALDAFQTKFSVDDVDVDVGVSLGTALYPDDGDSLSDLLHQADLAMYAAKNPGIDRALPHGSDWLQRAATARSYTDRASYRPAFLLENGMLAGLISSLETHETVDAFELLELACFQSTLRASAERSTFFSVPMGREILDRTDLVSTLRDILTATRADPARCEILVDASELGREPELWHQLRELGYGLGVMIDVDDFSPQRLLKMPLTRLHLGASFCELESKSSEQGVLLDLAVVFARAADAETVAHGVTTAAQMTFLQNAGVHCAGGPLVGKPIAGRELARFRQQSIHDWSARTSTIPDA